jgi:hypothetical protein
MIKISNFKFAYMIFHVVFLLVIISLYLFKNLYFGYELGDQIIILSIIGIEITSFITLLFYKKVSKYLIFSMLLFFMIISDIWVIYLLVNKI